MAGFLLYYNTLEHTNLDEEWKQVSHGQDNVIVQNMTYVPLEVSLGYYEPTAGHVLDRREFLKFDNLLNKANVFIRSASPETLASAIVTAY